MNTNKESHTNDVNSRPSQARVTSSNSGHVEDQASQRRHPVTGTIRRKYSREDNREVMNRYYLSGPKVRGYRKRMFHSGMTMDGSTSANNDCLIK